jgi:hypothetical protein
VTFDFAGYLADGLRSLDWVTVDLWIAVTGLAGFLSLGDVRSIIAGQREPSEKEYDVLALALNEAFMDRGRDHPMNYWDELPRV